MESKITSQGQVSIPAPIRQKLGLAPGLKVEWCVEGDDVIVRRAARYSSQDIHDALDDFRRDPAVGFADCLIVGTARKLGHRPVGTFDRAMSRMDDAVAP